MQMQHAMRLKQLWCAAGTACAFLLPPFARLPSTDKCTHKHASHQRTCPSLPSPCCTNGVREAALPFRIRIEPNTLLQ